MCTTNVGCTLGRILLLLCLTLPAAAQTLAAGQKGVAVEEAAKRFDRGRKWAVVVGINKYLDPSIPSLKYCVADARLVAETLVKHCGYEAERVLLITDDQQKDHFQPLRINLDNQIRLWLRNVQEGDTVLVFFSGHGFLDERGQGFLAPKDCLKAKLGLSAYRTDELRDVLQQCDATQKILILDCCHAGGLKSGERPGPSGEELGAAFRQAKGLITIASCRKQEQSREWEAQQHGLFTYFVAKGLQGEADLDGNNLVDSDELYRYLLEKVPVTAQKELNGVQTPVRCIPPDAVGVFTLARAERKVVEPRTLTATLTVRDRNAEGPVLTGAEVILVYRTRSDAEPVTVARGVSDSQGKVRLEVPLSVSQQVSGEFLAVVTQGPLSGEWPLPAFARAIGKEWPVYVRPREARGTSVTPSLQRDPKLPPLAVKDADRKRKELHDEIIAKEGKGKDDEPIWDLDGGWGESIANPFTNLTEQGQVKLRARGIDVDRLTKLKAILLTGDYCGASEKTFVNRNPDTIVVVGKGFVSHGALYSVGPIIAVEDAHFMGEVVGADLVWFVDRSNPRDRTIGLPVIVAPSAESNQAEFGGADVWRGDYGWQRPEGLRTTAAKPTGKEESEANLEDLGTAMRALEMMAKLNNALGGQIPAAGETESNVGTTTRKSDYGAGDEVVAVKDAPLKSGRQTVGSVRKGEKLVIEQVQDKWLWVRAHQTHGWILRQDVELTATPTLTVVVTASGAEVHFTQSANTGRTGTVTVGGMGGNSVIPIVSRQKVTVRMGGMGNNVHIPSALKANVEVISGGTGNEVHYE